MKDEISKNAMAFLNRLDLKGNEVNAFAVAMKELNEAETTNPSSETLRNVLIFLQRADVKGTEAGAYLMVVEGVKRALMENDSPEVTPSVVDEAEVEA